MRFPHAAFFSLGILGASTALAQNSASFYESVNSMVQQSSKLLAAEETLKAQIAAAQPALRVHLPQTSLSATYGLSGDIAHQSKTNSESALSANISAPIFRFGADSATRSQAAIAIEIAESQFLQTKLTLEKEMASLVFDAIKAKKQFEIESRIAQARLETLAKAEAIFKRGLLPQEELEKMRLDVGMAKFALADSNARMMETQNKLRIATMGVIPSMSWPWNTSSFAKLAQNSANDNSNLNSALRESRLQIQNSELELRKTKASAFPSISLSSSLSKSFSWQSESSNSNSNIPAQWNMGISATFPILEAMNSASNIESAARSLQAARFKMEDLQKNLESESFALRSTLRNLVDFVREREVFLRQGEKNLAKARERFLLGKISSNDLSIDETRLWQMEQTMLSEVAQLHQTALQFCYSVLIPLRECVTN